LRPPAPAPCAVHCPELRPCPPASRRPKPAGQGRTPLGPAGVAGRRAQARAGGPQSPDAPSPVLPPPEPGTELPRPACDSLAGFDVRIPIERRPLGASSRPAQPHAQHCRSALPLGRRLRPSSGPLRTRLPRAARPPCLHASRPRPSPVPFLRAARAPAGKSSPRPCMHAAAALAPRRAPCTDAARSRGPPPGGGAAPCPWVPRPAAPCQGRLPLQRRMNNSRGQTLKPPV
jgi:hypothetical protein